MNDYYCICPRCKKKCIDIQKLIVYMKNEGRNLNRQERYKLYFLRLLLTATPSFKKYETPRKKASNYNDFINTPQRKNKNQISIEKGIGSKDTTTTPLSLSYKENDHKPDDNNPHKINDSKKIVNTLREKDIIEKFSETEVNNEEKSIKNLHPSEIIDIHQTKGDQPKVNGSKFQQINQKNKKHSVKPKFSNEINSTNGNSLMSNSGKSIILF